MMSDYNLGDDSWFKRLYDMRAKWCTALNKDFFSAGILSSQMSESTNHAIGFKANKTTSLSEFFKIFTSTVERWRSMESLDEFNCSRAVKPSSSAPLYGLLRHAFEVYTLELFRIFQCEFEKGIAAFVRVLSTSEDTCTYMVSLDSNYQSGQVVVYNLGDSFISCSCKNFESCGWLCFHCLRIFHMFSVTQIPDRYIVTRWTKFAKSEIWGKVSSVEVIGNQRKSDIYWRQAMCRKYYGLLLKAQGDEDARRVLESGYERDYKDVEIVTSRCLISNVEESSSNNVLDPSHAKTKGKRKRIRNHFQRKKRNIGSVVYNSTNGGVSASKEFGSYTPNPRLF